jgi:predicted RecA/RadA family phage recombinase
MQNWKQRGFSLPYLVPAGGVTSGRGVLIGTHMFGVSTGTYAAAAKGEMITEGLVLLAKTSALAIAAGDAVYWDNTLFVVNKTATAQKLVGYATRAAANPSASVWVKLTPNAVPNL